MSFRANESARNAREEAQVILTRYLTKPSDRKRSIEKLDDIETRFGPVISGYPQWHPLVFHWQHKNHESRFTPNPLAEPSEEYGYIGLDHTVYFRNAFLTCPYGDGENVLESVEKLPKTLKSEIRAEKLDVPFYSDNVTPVLVWCDWEGPSGDYIPASVAIPLWLLKITPVIGDTSLGETWQTMRPYFLGSPHGSRTSHFVNSETAITMKKMWELMINTGMFGPIYMSDQH